MRKLCVPLLAVLVIAVGCTRVGPGYAGIKVSMAGSNRGVGDYPVTTGWVFYNPITADVVEYPTFVKSYAWSHSLTEGNPVNEEITFTTADQMQVAADVSVGYHINFDMVPHFYVKFRTDDVDAFTHGYLRNMARQTFDDAAGHYKIEQIMGDNGPFLREVREKLQAELKSVGVEIDQFGFIGAPRPPSGVIDAINAKVQATQLAIQKQNELVQVQADAAKEVAKAEGRAKAVLVAAEADSAYNRRINDSLTPALVEWQKAQRWDGKLPQVTSGAQPLLSLK